MSGKFLDKIEKATAVGNSERILVFSTKNNKGKDVNLFGMNINKVNIILKTNDKDVTFYSNTSDKKEVLGSVAYSDSAPVSVMSLENWFSSEKIYSDPLSYDSVVICTFSGATVGILINEAYKIYEVEGDERYNQTNDDKVIYIAEVDMTDLRDYEKEEDDVTLWVRKIEEEDMTPDLIQFHKDIETERFNLTNDNKVNGKYHCFVLALEKMLYDVFPDTIEKIQKNIDDLIAIDINTNPLIAYCEDSKLPVSFMTDFFNRLKLDFKHFWNGLEYEKWVEQGGVPDIVITDMEMPEKNGIEVINLTRSRFKNVPIIINTSMSGGSFAERAQEFGADYFIPKSEGFDVMQKALYELLNVKEGA